MSVLTTGPSWDSMNALAGRLIDEVATEATANYEYHRTRRTYPTTVTGGLSRATNALEFALPADHRRLASGYAASMRPDITNGPDPTVIATHLRRLIVSFDPSEHRRRTHPISAIDHWIGRKIRISGIVTAVRATDMYVWGGLAQRGKAVDPNSSGIVYGLEGVYLGNAVNGDTTTIWFGDNGEVLAADLIGPAIASLDQLAPVVHTIPLR